MTLYLILFGAGLLTILLPCILPLLPIVVGVSVAGGNKWRPLATVGGMLVSFVGFTFVLLSVLNRFVVLADLLQTGTFAVLFLFGVGFLAHERWVRLLGGLLAGLFFLGKGWEAVLAVTVLGPFVMEAGVWVASRLQQTGADIQGAARGRFGADSALTAFIVGLTLGLVWVPCAGPALAFAFTLVRQEPGLRAFLALLSYGAGTAVPLLLVGYGGQAVVHRTRSLLPYTGAIKRIAGVVLILTAIALRFSLFQRLQIFLVETTPLGDVGTRLEERWFGRYFENPEDMPSMLDIPSATSSPSPSAMGLPTLPRLARAPEFTGLSTWHNAQPLTMAELRGKVVLIDFWTYSCINCIRTLPYIQGYWDAYKDQPFVLIGVHTPEFVFEKSDRNVADAIARHGLTYPVAQDNDFGTWGAFANRYWPAKYLIDAQGYIRYTHFGEGAYEETDAAIRSLLAEAGVATSASGSVLSAPETPRGGGPVSAETYLGERSWPALQNAQGDPSDEVVTYKAPARVDLHKYALVGDWQLIDGERQVLRSGAGEIRMRFLGGEINLVLGLEDGALPAAAEVLIDGKSIKKFDVTMDDLQNLYTGTGGEHELTLKLRGKGTEAYAFTFGPGRE